MKELAPYDEEGVRVQHHLQTLLGIRPMGGSGVGRVESGERRVSF